MSSSRRREVWVTRISGFSSWKVENSSIHTLGLVVATESSTSLLASISRTSATVLSSELSIWFTHSKNTYPRVFRCSLFPWRSKSSVPSSFSRREIVELREGGEIKSLLAVCVRLSFSATALKYRNCKSSIRLLRTAAAQCDVVILLWECRFCRILG